MADGLKQRILDDLTAALKAGDKLRLGVVRMLKADIQKQEVELRVKKGKDYSLSDPEVLEVLARSAKQRRDSIESYRAGGREDLAGREEEELAVVEAYLPKQLDRDELARLVDEAVAKTGAAGPRDMGQVMKALMPEVKGRADGKLVNELVKARLGG